MAEGAKKAAERLATTTSITTASCQQQPAISIPTDGVDREVLGSSPHGTENPQAAATNTVDSSGTIITTCTYEPRSVMTMVAELEARKTTDSSESYVQRPGI